MKLWWNINKIVEYLITLNKKKLINIENQNKLAETMNSN